MSSFSHGPRGSPDIRSAPDPEVPASAGALRYREIVDRANSTELRSLLLQTKPVADQFKAAFRLSPAYVPDSTLTKRLQAWYVSDIGQRACGELAESIIQSLLSTSRQGHPGHDRRHILYRDVLSALRHCVDDQIVDYRSVYLLAALGHDVGRLPEPRLHGKPASGVAGEDHSYLSYALFKLLLDEHPEIPPEISDSLLFSVLVHQSGGDRECFAAQLAQRADREQIVGPEFILRTIGANVGCGRVDFGIPSNTAGSLPMVGHPDEVHVVTHLEFYARNLYPNIGSSAEKYITELKGMSMQFLALAYGPEQQAVLFGPEQFGDSQPGTPTVPLFTGRKTPLPAAVREWLKGGDNEGLLNFSSTKDDDADPAGSAERALDRLLSAPLAADPRQQKSDELNPHSPSYQENLHAALRRCSDAQLRCWKRAFDYAHACREYLDQRDHPVIGNALRLFSREPSVGGSLAMLVSHLTA